MKDVCFWMIRRKDTGEYYRPNKGPTWAKCGNWTLDRKRGKVYGGVGLAKASRTAWVGDYGKKPEVEIVRFRVVEEGVEA